MCHLEINVIRQNTESHYGWAAISPSPVADFMSCNVTDHEWVNSEYHINVFLQILKQIPGLVGILLLTEAQNYTIFSSLLKLKYIFFCKLLKFKWLEVKLGGILTESQFSVLVV